MSSVLEAVQRDTLHPSISEDTDHPNDPLSDSFTTIALANEEVPMVESEGLHRPLSNLVVELLEKYEVRGKPYAAPNVFFSCIRSAINQNAASNSKLQEAYKLLRARLKADKHATFIISQYNPTFVERQSIEHWDGHMARFLTKDDWAAFITVLNRFLHDSHDRDPVYAHQYTLPRDYAVAAAVDCGLSPSELEERLESFAKDTSNSRLYPSSISGTLGSSSSWQSLDI